MRRATPYQRAAFGCAAGTLVYLAFAFGCWDFNAGHWGDTTRSLCAATMLFLGAKVGEFAQEQSTAYKAIKKRAHIQPQAAKLAFKLDDMEEAKRDDFLRSLNGLLKQLNIFMPTDLVDAAEGKGAAGDAVIPIGERKRPQLATVPPSDGVDADLAGDEEEQQAAE